jgi:hypothetical protein
MKIMEITAWNRILIEKLMAAYQVKNFLLWNPKVHYCIHNQKLDLILNYINLVHIFKHYFLKINFNINFPFIPGSPSILVQAVMLLTCIHRFPQSLYENTGIIPLNTSPSFPFISLQIPYSLSNLSFDTIYPEMLRYW